MNRPIPIKILWICLFFSCGLVANGQQFNPLNERSVKSDKTANKSFVYQTINGRANSVVSSHPGALYSIGNNKVPSGVAFKKDPNGVSIVGHKTFNQLNKQTLSVDQKQAIFLAEIASTIGIREPNKELIIYHSEVDDLGFHQSSLKRYIKGVEVFGGDLRLTISEQDATIYGKLYSTLDASETPNLSKEQIIQEANHRKENHWMMSENDERWKWSAGKETQAELYWFPIHGQLRLAYVVDIHPNYLEWFRLIIDAQTGELIRDYAKTCTVDGPKTATGTDLNNANRTLNTYQLGSTYYLIDASRNMFSSSRSSLPDDPAGAIWTIDARNTAGSSIRQITSSNNTWADKSAVSAHFNAGEAYEYFRTKHGRNSINGSGGTIISVVNVTDESGKGLDNAYWNGQSMFYGNGRSAFKPLAGALDVAGHEMTHGVVSSTANLEYYSQSGAINESMADVFGAMMDPEDWKMGEDVVKTSVFKSGALRDLSNPHNGGSSLSQNGYQPMRMSEYYTGEDDYQGVHINSGIPNHAFYLLATNIGNSKAEKIYYRALVYYLTSSSEFLDLRYAIVKAASDLHGAASAEVSAVKSAFDQVEIYDPNAQSGGTSDGGDTIVLATNPGDEYILSVDVDVTNTNTLYRSNTAGASFKALSKTKFLRKPSVEDDGSSCVFVSTSKEIRRINLDGTFSESRISPDLIWQNVAVSKDGNRIAAISEDIDTSIFVYDFVKSEWKQFKLYNPTYSQGVNSGGVLYADAIEFDPTGEFILYDARNLIINQSGADLDYWDIGIIRVWDNKQNNWGDGKVEKLFSQLPKDVSIGNPTYSKNSPHIIAFDYIDTRGDTYAVLAKNTFSGQTSTIINNTRLGFPNYSNDDKKLLFDAETQSGQEVVAVVDLRTDKISASGSAVALIGDAKWGVWYADGDRKLLSDGNNLLSFAFPGLAGAPSATINNTNVDITVPKGTNLNALIPTFTSSAFSTVYIGSVEQTSGASAANFGANRVYTVEAQDGSKKNYTVKVNVDVSTSSNDLHGHQISIYPNPSNGEIWILGMSDDLDFVVIDQIGKIVKEGKTTSDSSINLKSLKSGLYFLAIEVDGKIIRHRIIVQ